jgi:hypothetical protein
VRHRELAHALAVERRCAGQGLVEHQAERVDVAARVDLGRAELLGRHVARGAQERAGLRDPVAAALRRQLGDPEVEDLGAQSAGDLGVGDQEDIVGLEIAVQDAGGVGGSHCAGDLADHAQRVGHGQRTVALEPGRQVGALEQLHDQVGGAVLGVAEIEDLDDAGVVDRRRRAGLVEEPIDDAVVVRDVGVEQLDRGAPAEQRVLAEVDRPHTAGPDRGEDAIRADD